MVQSKLTFPDWYKPEVKDSQGTKSNPEPNDSGPNREPEDCGVFAIKTDSKRGFNDIGCNVPYVDRKLHRYLEFIVLCDTNTRILSLPSTEKLLLLTNSVNCYFPTKGTTESTTKALNTSITNMIIMASFDHWNEDPFLYPLIGTSPLALILCSCLLIVSARANEH